MHGQGASVREMRRKQRTTHFVVGYVRGKIIGIVRKAEGKYLTGQPFRNFRKIADFTIDNQGAVCGQKLGKTAEGSPNVVDILKEIKMVFFYIKDNTDFREKA